MPITKASRTVLDAMIVAGRAHFRAAEEGRGEIAGDRVRVVPEDHARSSAGLADSRIDADLAVVVASADRARAGVGRKIAVMNGATTRRVRRSSRDKWW